MAAATLAREAVKLLREARAWAPAVTASPTLDRLRRDPALTLALAGKPPDPWQADLLRSPSPRTLLLCSRQGGKSVSAGAVALHTALTRPGSLVLLLSASERQAREFLAVNVSDLWYRLGRPVPGEATATALRLANGSRLLALPRNERTIRTFSAVALLVIDEAARVDDDLYRTVRPMLAVSRGRLVALSTPFGKRGWFYESWAGSDPWKRVRVPADQCPRITREFLASERRALGERWYRQEYLCSFEDVCGAVFSHDAVLAALDGGTRPLFR
jgi:hypothetical protein